MEATETQNLLPAKDEKMRLTSDQMIFSCIVLLPLIPVGMSLAFTSVILPQVNQNFSLVETSVFASMGTATSLCAHILTSTFVDRWGRSTVAIMSSAILIVACILLSTVSSFVGLCVGQALVGLTSGSAILPLTVYVTESIVSHHLYIRNSITSCGILATAIGIAFCYETGGLFENYRQVTATCAILTTISLCLYVIFIPESPTWLRIKGRRTEARLARNRLSFDRKVLTPYASADDDLNREHETIYDHIQKIKRPDVYKPLAVGVTLGFLQQFAGVQMYLSYLDEMMTTTYLQVDSKCLQMIAGIMPVFGVVAYNLSIPYTGLKKFYLFSAVCYTVAVFLIGYTEYLNLHFTEDSYTIDYVHIAAVCFYAFESGCGPGTVQYIIVGEIFPKDAKGFGAIVYFFMAIFLWFMITAFPFLKVYLTYRVYFVWTFFSLLTIPFIAYFVPETVGKTLREISREFSS